MDELSWNYLSGSTATIQMSQQGNSQNSQQANSQKKNQFYAVKMILGIITPIAGVGAFVYPIYKDWKDSNTVIVSPSSRFYCEQQDDSDRREKIWMVMYRHDKGTQPWLKMITTLGGNWTPLERCQEIARKLDIYRQHGLVGLTYREDDATPKQFVICAKTKRSGDNCPLVVTLKPDADPYLTLAEMTDNLLPGKSGSFEASSGGSPNSRFSPAFPVVNLQSFLAADDRKAGSTAAK